MFKIAIILGLLMTYCQTQAKIIRCDIANSKSQFEFHSDEFLAYELPPKAKKIIWVDPFYLCGVKLEADLLAKGVCEIQKTNIPQKDVQYMSCYYMEGGRKKVFGQANFAYLPAFKKYRFSCFNTHDNVSIVSNILNCQVLKQDKN